MLSSWDKGQPITKHMEWAKTNDLYEVWLGAECSALNLQSQHWGGHSRKILVAYWPVSLAKGSHLRN